MNGREGGGEGEDTMQKRAGYQDGDFQGDISSDLLLLQVIRTSNQVLREGDGVVVLHLEREKE